MLEKKQATQGTTSPTASIPATKEKKPKQLDNENTKRLEAGLPAIDSFEEVAREWHSKFKNKWTPKHSGRLLTRLEQDVFPYIGTLAPLAFLTEKSGKVEPTLSCALGLRPP